MNKQYIVDNRSSRQSQKPCMASQQHLRPAGWPSGSQLARPPEYESKEFRKLKNKKIWWILCFPCVLQGFVLQIE